MQANSKLLSTTRDSTEISSQPHSFIMCSCFDSSYNYTVYVKNNEIAASIMNGLLLPKLLTVNRFVLGKMGLFATTRQGSHVGLKTNYQ